MKSSLEDGHPQILHIVTRYLRGGSEVRIRDIVRALPGAGHHLIVGSHSDVELAERQVAPQTLTVLNSLVRQPNPPMDWITLRKLTALLRARSFDLLVTHQSKAGVLGRAAARWASGPPVIHSLSMANFGPGYPKWEDLLFRTIESRLARGTDAYVVVGTDLARRFELIGVPRRKLHVVRSGITLPTLADREAGRRWLRDRFGVPTDRPIVAYLGSLEWRKSVLDLVPYLYRMLSAPSAPRPYLVVAGEGPLSRPLIAALEAANLMHDAAVVGFVSDPGLVIAAASTLVLLSRAEGVPQVLVQASVLGRPWVAYDVDGARELIELGAPGTLVPLGDVAAAAQATRWIIDSPVPGRLPKFDASPWAPDVIAAAHRHVVEAVFAGRRGLPAETSQYAGTVARAS